VQAAILGLWMAGLPLLAAGLALDLLLPLRLGAAWLLAATLLDGAHQARMLRAADRPIGQVAGR
jgi:hypothetical protein